MTMFQSRSGVALHEQVWPSAGEKALATVVIVHGYGEHISRYDETARALAAAGFSVRGYDQRGHGQSGGVRGHCTTFAEYLDDLEDVLARARPGAQSEGSPLFLLGHSFGALVAPHFALRAPGAISGLVLTSPFWKLALAQPAVKIWAGKVASRLLPALSLPMGLKGSDVSRDPTVQAAYDADPLNNKNATARWFTEATTAQERLLERAAELTLPVLLVAGEADRVAAAAHARIVFDRLGSRDKTLRMLAGQFHEVLNEPKVDRDKTVAEIVEWLRAHASVAQRAGEAKLHAGEA